MRIAILGAGPVGLATAGRLACLGHETDVIDKEPRLISALLRDTATHAEPGLGALLQQGQLAGAIHYGIDAAAVLPKAQAIFIAVGTPPRIGKPVLAHVERAAQECADHARAGVPVYIRSTLLAGTAAALSARHGLSFIPNPELGETGSLALPPQRLIFGTASTMAQEQITQMLGGLWPLVFTAPEEAEFRSFADFLRHRSAGTLAGGLRQSA